MTYIDDAVREFVEVYRTTPVDRIEEALVAFLKQKLVESWKNGVQAGRTRRGRKPKATSEPNRDA